MDEELFELFKRSGMSDAAAKIAASIDPRVPHARRVDRAATADPLEGVPLAERADVLRQSMAILERQLGAALAAQIRERGVKPPAASTLRETGGATSTPARPQGSRDIALCETADDDDEADMTATFMRWGLS